AAEARRALDVNGTVGVRHCRGGDGNADAGSAWWAEEEDVDGLVADGDQGVRAVYGGPVGAIVGGGGTRSVGWL
ncbi:hypothetical protein B1218_35990, partial [Pseudomonas ogarae]